MPTAIHVPPPPRFEGRLSDLKRSRGVKHDIELSGEDLKALVGKYKVGW
jgi:hypothetical protein